jgi:hypothetical protein
MVTLRGGGMVRLSVVARLFTLGQRGATFERLGGGRFAVRPPEALTPDDEVFLHEYRDDARALLDNDALEEPT